MLPYRGTVPPVRLLLLVSATGGDIPTASFLDDHIFATAVAVADYCDPAADLPPHALVFNAIGDADSALARSPPPAPLVGRSAAAIINHPGAVLRTGRSVNAARLAALPGVVAPRMSAVPRATLAGPEGSAALAALGFSFPVLLRSPGFHTGRHFVMVESAAELAAAAAALPGDELLAIGYLDARGDDGRAPQIPRHDCRWPPLSVASRDIAALEGALFHRRHGR